MFAASQNLREGQNPVLARLSFPMRAPSRVKLCGCLAVSDAGAVWWPDLSALMTFGASQSGLWKIVQVLSAIRTVNNLDIECWQVGVDFCGFEKLPGAVQCPRAGTISVRRGTADLITPFRLCSSVKLESAPAVT